MNEPSNTTGSGTGLDPKVSSLLAYLFGPLGGIVFFLISKDKFVRFHALQSIFYGIVSVILYGVFLSIALWSVFFVSWLVDLAIFAGWIFLMVKAYNGEKYKMPLIGDLAEKYS